MSRKTFGDCRPPIQGRRKNRIRTVSFDELDLDVSDDEDRSVIYPEIDNRFGPCEDDCEDRLTARENVFDLGHCADESESEHGSPLDFCGSRNQRASLMHEKRKLEQGNVR